MTRNLKALGLALVAICALGAMAAQGASAAVDHEFHAEEENVVVTGTNAGEGAHKFTIGAAGTYECNKLTTESTQTGSVVEPNTYKTDTITSKTHLSECTFGGQPATVNMNHCAYVYYSETTKGNKHPADEGKEHANVEIECANAGEKIEIHTNLCTVTIKPQLIKHAVRYKNIANGDITVETTAEKIVLDKTRTTAAQPINGCLTFPPNGSAVGVTTGNVKTECFKDNGSPLPSTEKTTPTGLTVEGVAKNCTVTPGA